MFTQKDELQCLIDDAHAPPRPGKVGAALRAQAMSVISLMRNHPKVDWCELLNYQHDGTKQTVNMNNQLAQLLDAGGCMPHLFIFLQMQNKLKQLNQSTAEVVRCAHS